MKSRTVSYFLTPVDERELTSSILSRFPRAKFIDVFAWAETLNLESSSRDSIADCVANCYVWDPDSVIDFPASSKPTYHAAHFSRCGTTDDHELYLGQARCLVNPDDERQEQFCNSILCLIRQLKSGMLDAYNVDDDSQVTSGVTSFVVSPDAFARSDQDLTLVYGPCYYRPTLKNQK